MKRILLLNPPGSHPYTRDYFCSKVAKTYYTEHPIDLILLSGILREEGEVKALDGIVRRLSHRDALTEIGAFCPDIIFFLTGSASAWEDFPFLEETKACTGAKVFGIGDILREERVVGGLEWLDGALLDTMSEDALYIARGKYEAVRNAILKEPSLHKRFEKARGECEIPLPRHELFMDGRYEFPFALQKPFASVLTDYGCPYNCDFCVNGALGYKVRTLENVSEELNYLRTLGVREIFLRDETFGVPRKRAFRLLDLLMGFRWTAFSRADVLDDELLRAMKSAGCHTIIVGVETGNEELLERQKSLSLDLVRECFHNARGIGIKTVGTFILGLPGEDREAVERTIEVACSVGCDYASFNLFVPRPDTALSNGEWKGEIWDQSGLIGGVGNGILSAEELRELRRKAVRKFYLSPGFLWRQLTSLKNPRQAKLTLKHGIQLFKTIF